MENIQLSDPLIQHKLLKDTEVEAATGIKCSTLAAWRARGKRQNKALRFVRLGGKIRYRAADVAAFIESSIQGSEGEAA